MYELFQYVLENYDDGTKIVNSQTKLYDVNSQNPNFIKHMAK